MPNLEHVIFVDDFGFVSINLQVHLKKKLKRLVLNVNCLNAKNLHLIFYHRITFVTYFNYLTDTVLYFKSLMSLF